MRRRSCSPNAHRIFFVLDWRRFEDLRTTSVHAENGADPMSDKSPRNSMTKKSGKSLKEKRADKKNKTAGDPGIDISATVKKR